MNVEHTDRNANGKRDENHREEKVFALSHAISTFFVMTNVDKKARPFYYYPYGF